jgi:hypothetical protein
MGNGALGALHHYIDIYDVDAVYLSHLHPDHCMDLCGYYVALRYGPWRDCDRVPVWGPAATAERMARAYGVFDDRGMTDEFDFHAYPDGGFDIGDLRVTVCRVPHRGESVPESLEAFSIRLEHGGASLVYSGDTAPSSELVGLAAGADLLLCEAAFEDGLPHPPNLHLTGGEAGECAAAAQVVACRLERLLQQGDRGRHPVGDRRDQSQTPKHVGALPIREGFVAQGFEEGPGPLHVPGVEVVGRGSHGASPPVAHSGGRGQASGQLGQLPTRLRSAAAASSSVAAACWSGPSAARARWRARSSTSSATSASSACVLRRREDGIAAYTAEAIRGWAKSTA